MRHIGPGADVGTSPRGKILAVPRQLLNGAERLPAGDRIPVAIEVQETTQHSVTSTGPPSIPRPGSDTAGIVSALRLLGADTDHAAPAARGDYSSPKMYAATIAAAGSS